MSDEEKIKEQYKIMEEQIIELIRNAREQNKYLSILLVLMAILLIIQVSVLTTVLTLKYILNI